MRWTTMILAALAACSDPQLSQTSAPLDTDHWDALPRAGDEPTECPVIVPEECPMVAQETCPTVTPATETPWARPIPIAAVGDMRGQYARLFLGEINADAEHPVTSLRFRMVETVTCGADIVEGHFYDDLCDVVACDTLRMTWLYYAYPENDGVADGEVMYSDAERLPYWFGEGVDDDMSDFRFDADDLVGVDHPQVWLTVVAQIRADAPEGRYQLVLQDARWGDHGSLDPLDTDEASHHHLHGVPLYGTDFTTGAMHENATCATDALTAIAAPDGF